MKTSNIQTSHPFAIIAGWVDPVLGSDNPATTVDPDIENASGADLTAGTVVIVNASGQITTTTTAGYAGIVGVVIDDIDNGDFGAVAFGGPVDLVNVTSSVTAGDYGETSATPGSSDGVGATRTPGSFVQFTSSGTTPSGTLLTGGGGSVATAVDASMVPYYIPVDETFTVPLYKQALFSEAIEVDGALVVNGLLLGVD